MFLSWRFNNLHAACCLGAQFIRYYRAIQKAEAPSTVSQKQTAHTFLVRKRVETASSSRANWETMSVLLAIIWACSCPRLSTPRKLTSSCRAASALLSFLHAAPRSLNRHQQYQSLGAKGLRWLQ